MAPQELVPRRSTSGPGEETSLLRRSAYLLLLLLQQQQVVLLPITPARVPVSTVRREDRRRAQVKKRRPLLFRRSNLPMERPPPLPRPRFLTKKETRRAWERRQRQATSPPAAMVVEKAWRQ
ncbi:unnamed protein product [Ectocarpus sp. 13 AM-2016]